VFGIYRTPNTWHLRSIHDAGGTDLTLDDLDLIAELLLAACAK